MRNCVALCLDDRCSPGCRPGPGLQNIMKSIYKASADAAKEYNTTLQGGANIAGFLKARPASLPADVLLMAFQPVAWPRLSPVLLPNALQSRCR